MKQLRELHREILSNIEKQCNKMVVSSKIDINMDNSRLNDML